MSTTIDEVVAAARLGSPSARKSGRNAQWPYVPVIMYGDRQHQLRGLAFKTRDEAVESASEHIARQRSLLAAQLALPHLRSLREWYGLPRELPEAVA